MKTEPKANYLTATDAMVTWRDDVLTGKAPKLYKVGDGELSDIEVGPGLVTLIGGAPGAGKTAFTMQLVVDGLQLNPDLRALVCNVEMPPNVLMDRQLARYSGINLTTIRYRSLDEKHGDRIGHGMGQLEAVADRLCFLRPPFDLGNVAATADAFEANLILLDYIQRYSLPGDQSESRQRVNQTMDYLRRFADADIAVMVVSAVTRSRDSRGQSTYDGRGLNLASFRESSELEFGADDAFIITEDHDEMRCAFARLKHLKSRHGECRDRLLAFDKPHQRFFDLQSPGGRQHINHQMEVEYARQEASYGPEAN